MNKTQEKNRIVKRNIRDSVFSDLFADKKYLLQLYQAIHPEDSDVAEDDLSYITIENVLTDQIYNDLGFRLGNKLILLIEAQSTWTMNIIIRVLIYLATTYQEYFFAQGIDLYGSKKVELPEPEFYVIYTGDRTQRPEYISLSEEYFGGKETALEIKVRMLYGDNKEDIIGQYVAFTKVYAEQRKLHGRTRETVLETIRICKDENCLKEYLENRESEVVDIMMTLFDEETIMKNYTASLIRETREEGVRNFVEACQELGISLLDTVEKLITKYGFDESESQAEVKKYWKE